MKIDPVRVSRERSKKFEKVEVFSWKTRIVFPIKSVFDVLNFL
jgi:hypothetical protein